MSNSLERKVRIDQSHCNYQLANRLADSGWSVLFRDPGRVTRGASGSQAQVLGIFERTGLPIPDIAAKLSDDLLLVEVDKSARNNEQSFRSYREHASRIIGEFNSTAHLDGHISRLLVGFCKVGRERLPAALMSAYDLDLVVSFDEATPILSWRSGASLRKN